MSSDPLPSASAPPNPPPPLFPDDDLEDDVVSSDDSDDDDNDNDNDVVPDPDSSDPDPDPDHDHDHDHDQDDTVSVSPPITIPLPPPPSSITPSPPPPSTSTAITAIIATAAPTERKPIDDSRRLFQRLWTDEDEIELLQGFLDYTSSRGGATASGHHHDTAAFYDQIKNKLQLEFNKNQLVEKLRRLKKKYRNVLSKMSSGKDFVFKSPHDQATFEISSKIWSNLSTNYRSIGGSGGGGGAVIEYDDDDQNPNRNAVYNPVTIAAATPPRPVNSSYVISHINLNSASPGGTPGGYDMTGGGGGNSTAGLSKLSTRKRPRIAGKIDEKLVKTEVGVMNHNGGNNTTTTTATTNSNSNLGPNNYNYVNNVGVSSPLQGLVEETVRNCLSPVLKNLINSAVSSASVAGSPNNSGSGGFKGVGTLALNAVPLNFAGVSNVEGGMDEKWRKQQIMELEVYSKRLELVQDQIKSSLEELRSMES